MEIAHQNPSSARILIADDHALFAETLRGYLEKAFTVIATVADGRAMLQEANRLRPDVIVAGCRGRSRPGRAAERYQQLACHLQPPRQSRTLSRAGHKDLPGLPRDHQRVILERLRWKVGHTCWIDRQRHRGDSQGQGQGKR